MPKEKKMFSDKMESGEILQVAETGISAWDWSRIS